MPGVGQLMKADFPPDAGAGLSFVGSSAADHLPPDPLLVAHATSIRWTAGLDAGVALAITGTAACSVVFSENGTAGIPALGLLAALTAGIVMSATARARLREGAIRVRAHAGWIVAGLLLLPIAAQPNVLTDADGFTVVWFIVAGGLVLVALLGSLACGAALHALRRERVRTTERLLATHSRAWRRARPPRRDTWREPT